MKAVSSLLPAIKLSQQILQAIEQEQWDDIASFDQQRTPVIEQYFKTNSNIDREQTQKLKQLNDEIVSRLIDIQQKNRNQQMSLTQAQKASKAYLENT